MTYLFLPFLSAGDVNPNPEHTLQSLPQPGEFLTSTFSNGLPTPDHVVHHRCVSQFSSMALAPRDMTVTILPTTADGHCFIYALRTSIILYLHRDFTHVNLLHCLRNEVALYEDLYLGFYAGSKQMFRYESIRYFLSKVYNSNFGNIIPLIAANALNIQIEICLSPHVSLLNCRIVQPFRCAPAAWPLVILDLQRQHNSGTSPLAIVTLSTLPRSVPTSATSSTSPRSVPTSATSSTLSRLVPADATLSTSQCPVSAGVTSSSQHPALVTATSTKLPCSASADVTSSKSMHATPAGIASSMPSDHPSPASLSPWYFLTRNRFSIVHMNIQGLLGQSFKKCDMLPMDTNKKLTI